jgi:VCBS repeat-containing protein
MKKKIFISTVMSSLLLAFSGCGGSSSSSTSTTTQEVLSQGAASNMQGNGGATSDSNEDQIKVLPAVVVNSKPTASPDSFDINDDTVYNGKLHAIDTDGDNLTFELTQSAKYGNLTLNQDGTYTYTPQKGYEGEDEFTFKVSDGTDHDIKKVTINVTKAPLPTPNAPSNLKLEALSSCKIKISWQDNSDNESGFDIYRDGKFITAVKENTTTTYICGGMEPLTTYNFSVKAKNAAGSSDAVSADVTTKDLIKPKKPTDLKAKASLTSVRISWSDNSKGEDVYNIYLNGKLIKTLKADSTTCLINDLTPNSSYTFVIEAKNRKYSSKSDPITISTLTPNFAPVITINGEKNQLLVIGDEFVDLGAVATDKEDGNLSIETTSDVNSSKAGEYTVIYSATDSEGASAKAVRKVKVVPAYELNSKANIPYDANLELGDEKGILYYVDPRPEENGLNRALRIDYINWTYEGITVNGINPHSLDRAGDSDKFYVRTQNSNSFDVVNFKEHTVKTVDMGEHKPRAIGATNLKYNLQLISVRNRQVVDVIDTKTDAIIASLGDETETPGITTGHALWFDEDHFGLIDRAKPQIVIYKVVDNNGTFEFEETDRVETDTALHAIERVAHPITREDLVLFYGNGEGNIAKGGDILPYMREYIFDPKTGKLNKGKKVDLTLSTASVHGRPPITHHTGITPDGKYIYAPVFDGNVYIIDRESMSVVKTLKASLGAAHVEFSKSLNLAIITNHWSNELTIIDLNTQEVKKRLTISDTQEFHEDEPHLLQPHFSYLSEDGKYFYTFATQDGDFLKINLETLEVEDKLHTGGAPEQAHS